MHGRLLLHRENCAEKAFHSYFVWFSPADVAGDHRLRAAMRTTRRRARTLRRISSPGLRSALPSWRRYLAPIIAPSLVRAPPALVTFKEMYQTAESLCPRYHFAPGARDIFYERSVPPGRPRSHAPTAEPHTRANLPFFFAGRRTATLPGRSRDSSPSRPMTTSSSRR